jgi:dipeptidase E
MPLYEPGKELVDVIDEEGRTLEVVTRREMRQRRLLHRCTYVLVFNRAGELFIHLRTPLKDVYPSHWDIAIGGVVAAGESFAQGVQRELQEELGVQTEAEELFPFRYADENSALQGMVYRAMHEGPFHLQPEEIVRGEFVPLHEIEERARHQPFCPDSLALLTQVRARWPRAFATLPTNQRILLGSGGFRTEERVKLLTEQMRDFFGPVGQLLFIPYALQDYNRYLQTMVDKGIHAGYQLDGIHLHADPQKAIANAQALFIGGGNTFRLLSTLYRFGLLDVIRQRVQEGMPYLGISAGSNVASPTIKTTNDMPITQPPSLDALGLVPFQINPHYFHGSTFVRQEEAFQEHFGETRDDRLREFHEMNDTPVIGLWEAGLLRIEKGNMLLLGAPARIFRRGMPAVDVEPGRKIYSSLGW